MGPQDRGEAEGADPAPVVRGGDPGSDRDQGDRARDCPPAAQGRDRQVLRRRRHSQAQVAREAEGGKEADEAGWDRRDSTGGLPGGTTGRIIRSPVLRWVSDETSTGGSGAVR